ncbi:DUF4879 domain-containing protein [Clostridium gasigenes]|uniref:DUF4879 domain-containing protein n=1 Tax=Clostridium gasigenes TaxID=94869 RepID=A0A7X0SCD8_9CLOT|nr:DUF4879 domain-containing protein [Clostridium gasigenes]MBB6714910.1 DUF4879 domain-containing protein [Clostridium gasigenes]
MPQTKAYAAPAAPGVYSFQITGMSEESMGDFPMFLDNKVETDATIYVKIKQLGYGSKFINVDGVYSKFQEVQSVPIIEYINYGKTVVGWDITYKIDNLEKGMHNIEFGCIGVNFPSRTLRDNATILKI